MNFYSPQTRSQVAAILSLSPWYNMSVEVVN